MAEECNTFFASAGRNVHNSVNPTIKKPTEFLPPREHHPPELELREISQGRLISIINEM